MATQADHFQNTRARLIARLKEIEQEADEVREMLRVFDRLPQVLGSTSPLPPSKSDVEPVKTKTHVLQNRNTTALVREYIDQHVKEDEVVNVPALTREWLMQKHNVRGEYRNLSAQVHVILKKESGPGKRLGHEKGVGYFKPRREDGSKQILRLPVETSEGV